MRTYCRITVFSDSLPELERMIRLCATKVEYSPAHIPNPPIFFDIDDSQPHFNEILELAEEIKGKAQVSTMFFVSFTEEECFQAKYLHVRSTFAGLDSIYYPGQYEQLHYHETVMIRGRKIYDRYEHTQQVAPTIAKKKPIWRADRQFCSDYGSAMQNLYCSDVAKTVIMGSGLTGVQFHEVLSEKTQAPFPDLWQLWPKECDDFLKPGPYMQARVCKDCGKIRYYSSGGRARLMIREDIVPEGLDFMQVAGAVGADTGYPYNVVSHRAYCVLKQSSIARALVFEPLENAVVE